MIKLLFSAVSVLLIFVKANGQLVDLTTLDTAVESGAVCLDGSAPAYQWDKGSGAGIRNWMVFLQEGAWCNDIEDCKRRSNDTMGSSKRMDKSDFPFTGILNSNSADNPDFHDWNRICVRYCDGASFTGDVDAVDPANNLHFRGARILKAVVDELLAKGMNDSDNVVLTGCSAGGLSVILNCDRFAKIVASSNDRIRVKCVADAGYFVNIKDLSGAPRVEEYYDQVVSLHGSEKHLSDPCKSKMKPGLCFFPENMVRYIETPIFFVNAEYDVWQIDMNLAPDSIASSPEWLSCKKNIAKCSGEQWKAIEKFELEFFNAFEDGVSAISAWKGYFINGCYTHCQTKTGMWFSSHSPRLNGKTIANAVGDWVLGRAGSNFQVYGPPYPEDTTCENFVNNNTNLYY